MERGWINVNKKETWLQRQKHLDLLEFTERTKINKLVFGENESREHAHKKLDVCLDLLEEGKEFITEARFTGSKGRCDVYDVTTCVAIEIVVSESKKSIELKKQKYPCEVIVV